MRFRTTLILAAALVLLSLSYYFLELKKAEEEGKTKLASFTQDEVTGFSIRRGDKVITLTRDEKHWRMTQPVEDRGDTREISALLGNITRAKIERTLKAKDEALADFGLKEPVIVFTVQLKDKEHPFTLEIGSATPAGFSVYARRPAEDTVLLAPSTVKTSLDKEPFAFRSKVPLVFEQEKVTAISLRFASLQLRMERDGEKAWRITTPIEAKADSGRVSNLIRSLTEEYIVAFLDQHPADLKQVGLSPPRGEIRLTLEGGAEASLLLGSVKERGGLYARRDGEEGVLELKADFEKKVPKKVEELRDRTLLTLDREAVRQIELTSPKGRTFLKKVNGSWKIERPEQASADQQAVEDLLWDLGDARITEFVDDHAKSLKPYGLDTPAVTIRLSDQEGNALTGLALNRATKKEGAYARVDDTQAVYLVKAEVYDRLDKGPFDLRFRQLLRFETWDVGKVALSRDGQEILLEKRKEEWEVKKPREGNAKYAAVTNLLNDIKNLKWEKLVTKESTDLTRYGLEKPAITFTLTTTKGQSLGTVLVGKTEGDLVYAKLQDRPEIYALPSTFLNSLPQDPAALLE